SWISDVIEDTPTKSLYSDIVSLATNYPSTTSAEYVSLSLTLNAGSLSLTANSKATCNTGDGICDIDIQNNDNPAEGFYISRDATSTTGDYAQRVLISTS